MSLSSLVFLNTTDAPVLSPETARQMRGHITKLNFAKRRQQKAMTTEKAKATKKTKRKVGKETNDNKSLNDNSADQMPSFYTYQHMINHRQDLQLLISLTCLNPPGNNPNEAAWVELFGSEPALVEATMAVGMRHWSPQPSWQEQADMYSSKALNSTINKITGRETDRDGFLAAVLTMAFGARLMQSDAHWVIHVEGVAQIIQDRRSRGIEEPDWFNDILVLDAANYIFNFPRFYYPKAIEAMGDHSHSKIGQLAELCEGVITLRKSIHLFHMLHLDLRFVSEEIEMPLMQLGARNQRLRNMSNNKYIHATSLTLEIILCLLWPPISELSQMNDLTRNLQEILSQLPKRPCPYMNLTSCQFIIGAVAAAPGSDTRRWFLNQLTGAARAMQSRGWNELFELLKRMVKSDTTLMEWYFILSKEENGSNTDKLFPRQKPYVGLD